MAGSGAPARDAEGRRPSDPGMTELSSERLVSVTALLCTSLASTTRLNPHVTEHVLGQEHTVELARVGDHDHGCRVDQLVLELEVRVVSRHDLRDGLSPESGRGEHVGLVDGDDGERRGCGLRNLGSDVRDSLNLGDGVDGLVPRHAVRVGLLSLAEVCRER